MAFGKEMDYQIIAVTSVAEGSLVRVGDKLLIATELRATFEKETGIAAPTCCGRARATRSPARCRAHPLRGKGYDFDVPMFAGDFVTTEQGTGIVHIAPGHGADDWELGPRQRHRGAADRRARTARSIPMCRCSPASACCARTARRAMPTRPSSPR